ncbi:DUF1272 domain-containing protein [Polycladomyces zharkentensis]|nr:DUF1272 domain-containing protein [Polycladomyces sp. WAk]
MKDECEKCGKSLHHHDEAYICSFECTCCRNCTEMMLFKCPNWRG